jgi:hypothetical protein
MNGDWNRRWKAAVNKPHSKRCARFESAQPPRQRLDCGDFSTALGATFTGAIA